MQKVVKIPLICEQTDKDGNPVDYKEVYKILWNLQTQTRDIKNKTVQLCWEFLNFSSDYYKKKEEYPSEKDALGYTLSGFVYDKFKTGYDLYSANISVSSREACTAFSNTKKEMLKGERSVLNYKSNQPLDLYNKAIGIDYADKEFHIALSLLNREGSQKHNFKSGKVCFKAMVKDNSTKTILERCIDKEYKISGSKLIYNQKKKMWELHLSYGFDGKLFDNLDKSKILGVDLGVHYPIYASIYGEYVRFKIEGGEVEAFRKQVEARKISLLRQTKYCGEGKVGHGRNTRCKAAYNVGDKIARFRDTVNHKYSKALIDFAVKNGCGIIQMERLAGVTKDANKFLKNWSFFDLQQKIEYKAKAVGIKIVYIEPKYTSQRCSKCGYIDAENRPEQAVFHCKKCDYSVNADFNASQNISIKDIDKVIAAELKKAS